MKKVIFSVMLCVVLVFGKLAVNAQPLNTNDSLRVHNFLIQSSSVMGESNGKRLNPFYFNENTPSTWLGFTWVNDGDSLRLSSISIPSAGLTGNLNLKGCDSLVNVNCNGNSIISLMIDDVVELNCSNNLIEDLVLGNATSLEELYCNDNRLSFLNIQNSNNLQVFVARNNNLSFARLIMPSKYSTMAAAQKSGWAIGMQNEFKPDEVIKAGSNYHCEGGVVDFSTLRGLNYSWFAAPPFPPVLLQTGTDYIVSSNNIFEFSENNMNNLRMVYCTITNPNTHHDLVMQTVSFQLTHYYYNNDVSKLRYFLEQPSMVLGKKNGDQVNINYNVDVPRSYGVTWELRYEDGIKQMRCVSIDTFGYKELAGHLDVSGMTELEQIIITGNEIESIQFGDNFNLWRLNCSLNVLTELNIEELPELLVLVCNDNFIEELDVTNNRVLTYIDISNNALSRIEFNSLNKLKELYCNNNVLTELNVANLKNLERLHLDNNYVKELNLTDITSLQRLSANNNLLTTLDLSNCIELVNISINNNKLIELNMTGLLLPSIERLDCSDNKLNFNTFKRPAKALNTFPAYLHPQDFIGIDHFIFYNGEYYTKGANIDLSEYVYSSAVTSFQLYTINSMGDEVPNGGAVLDGRFNISSVEGQKIVIKSTCSAFPGLTLTTPIITAKYEFDAHDVDKLRTFLNQYSKFGNESNGLTNGIILNPNYDPELPETFSVIWKHFNGIYRLSEINWHGISDLKGNLDLSNCIRLDNINIACYDNLSRNDITSLVLDGCSGLRIIDARYSQLETLNIRNCTNLNYVDCAYNKITTDINLLNSKSITYIDFTDNKIENMLVHSLPSLLQLFVGNNLLHTLDISGNNILIDLECNNNFLTELNIYDITTFIHINFSNNKVTEFDINDNSKLRLLYCDNNQLTRLVLKNCIELSALTCSNNKLTEIDLLGVPYLYQLETENNALTFRTLQYVEIPNEVSLHPQAIVSPSGIENHILRADTLDLSEFFIDNDTIIPNITLRYVSSGDVVDTELYNLSNNVISDFHNSLMDTSIFCEMRHSYYPNLVLRTIHFNTKKPWRYNEDELEALRKFLNQPSKIEDMKNGTYLSENYNSDDPETFPGVEWIPIDPEFRVGRIKWNDKPELQGNINFNPLVFMDTLQINGLNNDNTGIDSMVIDNCTLLKEIQLQNNAISRIKLDKCKELQIVNLSNNELLGLDLTELDMINRLDISRNALTFTSFILTTKPESIQWWPQREIVPNNVTLITTTSDYDYELRDSSINLAEFGDNVIYLWYDENDNIISSIKHYGNGSFIIPESMNNKAIYCLLTATDNLKTGLTLKTVNFYIELNVSISEDLLTNCNIYPNPANNYITIDIVDDFVSNNLNINVINTMGKIVKTFSQTSYTNSLTLNLSDIDAGTYFIQILTDSKKVLYPIVISR